MNNIIKIGETMPGTKNVSANVKELYHANSNKPDGKRRKRDQILAVAYSQARKAGAKV